MDTSALLDALTAQTDGLLFLSESESPVTVHRLAEKPALARDGDSNWTAESLLAGQCESEDENHAARWRKLTKTLNENLTELSASVVGKRNFTVSLAGRTSDDSWFALNFQMVWT